MIRLLAATLLVTSFSVVADTKVPNIFIDGTPAKASEVNENFDALEAAIEAIPADAIKAVTSADLDMDGNRVLFSNVYSQLADLPSATDNHGMFAHVHETGEAYYAHAGNWIQIAKQSSIDGASATTLSALTCTTNQIIKYDGNEWVCAAMPADGAKGDTGPTGPTGADGATGPAGADGADGTDGTDGADGVGFPGVVATLRSSSLPDQDGSAASNVFDAMTNIASNSSCTSNACDLYVQGVSDHRRCVTQIEGVGTWDLTTFANRINIFNSQTTGNSVAIVIHCIN